MEIIGFLILLALSALVVGALGIYAARKSRQRSERETPGSSLRPTFGQGKVHTRVYFFPGCLVFSLIASIVLTILLNLIIRAF
jgi:hypothetical protein